MWILNGLENWGLLILRIGVAAVFIAHGWPKIFGGKKMAEGMGSPQMGGFLIFLGLAEVLGGLATIAGFLTQLANIGFAIIMLGAIGTKIGMIKAPFVSMEKVGWDIDLLLLGAAVALIFLGAGSISIDAMIGLWS